MSSAPLFDLLTSILDDHLRGESRSLTVIPVIDEDLQQDHSVVEAAFRRYGGDYVATDRIPNAEVTGVIDSVLIEIVRTTISEAHLGYEIEIMSDGPLVQARLTGGALPINSSQRTVLAVAAALFSESFQRSTLGAVSWNEATLDEPTRRAVWELMTTQLNGRRIGKLSTLISISQGAIDPGIHCTGALSARYAISRGRFLER